MESNKLLFQSHFDDYSTKRVKHTSMTVEEYEALRIFARISMVGKQFDSSVKD